MKCPECKTTKQVEVLEVELYCGNCETLWIPTEFNLIDPAELLELVEKAKSGTGPRCRPTHVILDAVESYLSGDPGPLKKLAGE